MRVLAAILLLGLAGCSEKPGLPVRFVVPNGYRGTFSVTLDTANGVAVPVTNGEFMLNIPASGKLSISFWDCMGGRHVVSARYANGKPLPTGHDDAAVSLRIVTFKPDTKTAVLLIGTQKEADEASRNFKVD